MYLDFAAALIFIICIIRGEKKGVIESFASAFGWLFSLFFTFLYCYFNMDGNGKKDF